MRINAEGIHYRELNRRVRRSISDGEMEISIDHVRGQRYIGVGLGPGVCLEVSGVAGNDLGAFMNGAELVVRGNGQDGVGNTMNRGRIVIDGDAGDVLGHSMRGGEIFVRGRVGYRAGIHMKAYQEQLPTVVIGKVAGDYVGEYMAGGILIVLGLGEECASPVREYVGTGMHGGVIYVRGTVEPWQLGREVALSELDDADWRQLGNVLTRYGNCLNRPLGELRAEAFVKLSPFTSRPYGRFYAY